MLAWVIKLQWGFEFRSCQDFEWSKCVWLWNGPIFKCHSKTCQNSKYPVLKYFRFSNVQFSDPHCIHICVTSLMNVHLPHNAEHSSFFVGAHSIFWLFKISFWSWPWTVTAALTLGFRAEKKMFVFLFFRTPVFDLSCLGLSKVQFPTACLFNSNDYAPLAIRSYFDSLFKILGHPSLLNATGRMTEKLVST